MSDMAACAAFIRDRLSDWEQEAREWQAQLDDDIEVPARLLGGIVDPARVLAQVAAMRAIVELHSAPATTLSGPEWVGCFTCIDNPRGPKPCPTLGHLAAIWSDHEAYDPAWAPDA